MEKSDKKRILTRVLIVIAALTLLSCCFLGSTFAKYVTTASGNAKITVAEWNVDLTPEGSGNITIGQLSPAVSGNTHDTGWKKVAVFKNTGDVKAQVTITGVKLDVADAGWESGYDSAAGHSSYANTEALNNTFKIAFSTNSDGSSPLTSFELAAETGSVTLYANVTWTTQSDAQDTFYGEWLQTLTWNLTYSAVQSSQIPE